MPAHCPGTALSDGRHCIGPETQLGGGVGWGEIGLFCLGACFGACFALGGQRSTREGRQVDWTNLLFTVAAGMFWQIQSNSRGQYF